MIHIFSIVALGVLPPAPLPGLTPVGLMSQTPSKGLLNISDYGWQLKIAGSSKENQIPKPHNNNVPAPLLDLGTSQQGPAHAHSASKPATISGIQLTESRCELSDVIFQC